jgi:glutamine synthetase
MAHYLDEKNVKLFTEMGVYTKVEMNSHYEIKLEKYAQILNIEVQTMLEMINKDILPAAFKFMDDVSKTVIDLKSVVPGAKAKAQESVLQKLDALTSELSEKESLLAKVHDEAVSKGDCMKIARAYVDSVIPVMTEARNIVDKIEPLLGETYKPFPSYEDLLFRV